MGRSLGSRAIMGHGPAFRFTSHLELRPVREADRRLMRPLRGQPGIAC